MDTTQTTKYLALYTGPGGPISAIFEAASLDEAIELAAASTWYDDARADLDDADGVDLSYATAEVIRETAAEHGWTMAARGATVADYDIYISADDVEEPLDVGDRVEAGDPGTDEHDIGTVIEITGDMATVAWDGSLERTAQTIDSLTIV